MELSHFVPLLQAARNLRHPQVGATDCGRHLQRIIARLPVRISQHDPYIDSSRGLDELGISHKLDSSGGNRLGISTDPLTLKPAATNLRWDAARAYWYPAEGKSNLKIIRGMARCYEG